MDRNRLAWIVIFFIGTVFFSFSKLDDATDSFMGWFLLTSFWSAVCGIGYTVMDWMIEKK
ncbi:MAG: hypothetical protein OEY11_13520 [Gammaproteobacteria bacterium]|nr:hypothetical protein [Gammaproteobacteria bacterium]